MVGFGLFDPISWSSHSSILVGMAGNCYNCGLTMQRFLQSLSFRKTRMQQLLCGKISPHILSLMGCLTCDQRSDKEPITNLESQLMLVIGSCDCILALDYQKRRSLFCITNYIYRQAKHKFVPMALRWSNVIDQRPRKNYSYPAT